MQQYVPSAAPGCRAPHVWLGQGDRKISTLDLLGRGFVLLAGPRGAPWREAAARLQSPRLVTHVIGEDIADPDAGGGLQAYGVDPEGAVLVRPDGHVAWRARAGAADPASALRQAVDAVLSRGSDGSAPEAS